MVHQSQNKQAYHTGKDFAQYDRFYLRDKTGTPDSYEKHCRGFRKKLSTLLPEKKDIKILDIGCGCGFLVYFLKAAGYHNLTGIDLNEKLIALAKSKVDADFFAADAIDFLKKNQLRYDVIFLWNILEHIEPAQVVDVLKVLNHSLSDGGFVVVRTPNMTNILAQGHFHDDFTHRTSLTEQSLEQVAREADFFRVEFLNQFRMQNLKGKLKAIINFVIHKFLLWLRGGTKPRIFYRNLYVVLYK